MSRLESIKNAAESPKNLRDILESMGSSWADYIAMYAERNRPFWGWGPDPNNPDKYVHGYEINPNAVEYGYYDLTEEEKQEAAERMYYDEPFEL
jgi:hypothetical protein